MNKETCEYQCLRKMNLMPQPWTFTIPALPVNKINKLT